MAAQEGPAGALPPGLAQLFEIVLNTAADNRSFHQGDLETFRAAGAQAAVAGHRLASVIDAYLRGAGELWEQVLSDPAAQGRGEVLELGRMLRRLSEDAVAALATGYEDAQRSSIRAEEALRRAFLDDLLSGQDQRQLPEQARQLELQLPDRSVVAAARAEHPTRASVLLERAERLARARLGSEGCIVATHHGLLVVVVAADDPSRLRRLLPALRVAEPVGWRIGIGRAHDGPAGVAASFADARAVLELAARLDWPEPVVAWRDLIAHRLLVADPSTAAELVELVVRPLIEARRGSLLPTVQCYIDCGGNMAEMARALSLSPRAVAYRLERIEALTGRSLRVADDRFVVELAVRCHRALSRPGSA